MVEEVTDSRREEKHPSCVGLGYMLETTGRQKGAGCTEMRGWVRNTAGDEATAGIF